MSLTVRILPTDEPTFEVVAANAERTAVVVLELDVDQAEAFREQLHQLIIATQVKCAHPSCRNHATSESGYCGRDEL